MTQYLLSIGYPAGAQAPDQAQLDKIMTDVRALAGEMVEKGVWVFGAGLHPSSTATVVVDNDGDAVLTDGPFIESKEQIGGLTVIEAADLDEALGWAQRQSRATGTPVEVRPFIEAPLA